MAPTPPRFHRSVRTGGLLLLVGTLQFLAAYTASTVVYPHYSTLGDTISDLGNTATSPWHLLFNASLVAFGVLVAVGLVLAWGAFPPGSLRVVGLSLAILAAIGAVFVGLFPENVNGAAHDLASLVAFLPGSLSLIALGSAMGPETRWKVLRAATLGLGILSLASLVLYQLTSLGTSAYLGLVERLIVFPLLVWLLATGEHLITLPTRAPATKHLVSA
ncbi:MAG: DUF998 domain-containing protein [Thermoplasmata archaeon]